MTSSVPLAEIKVVEFTHMVMGPAAGAILAGLGADVVRVEPIGGDRTRSLLGSGAGYFPMYNRHKESICIDLKSPEGVAVARDLALASDVLIENFRPGAMDRLGLGYQALKEAAPRLIYCSAKGFLPGPYERRTALDEVAQMMGGLAYMTGPPGSPLRAGSSVIDVTGGMFGVIGILAAIEERHRTGQGGHVTSALFETTAYLVGQHMAQFAVTGKPAAPMPARLSAWAVYDLFDTADHLPLFIGVVTDQLWAKFCELFGLNELWADLTLRKNNQRVLARERILPVVAKVLKRFTRDALIEKLESTGIPFAPIGKPEDLFDDPHLIASGQLEAVTLIDGTQTRLPSLPLRFEGESRCGDEPIRLPDAGHSTRSVLQAIDYDENRINRLLLEGFVAGG
jgi:crotonobetainyl-CoA:carnitine CoA-transferase CaiB-like acyl-CoA transferase